MTPPRTLHEGGTGLNEAATDAYCRNCLVNYAEAKTLRESCHRQDVEIAALITRCQWLTLLLAVAFGAGFMSCAWLTQAGLEALK